MANRLRLLESFLKTSGIHTATDPTPHLFEDAYNTTGDALAVLFPTTSDQVQQIVRFALGQHLCLIPQGGNTSRTKSSVPTTDREGLIVNLGAMARIENISDAHDSITLEVGCTLAVAQNAVAEIDRIIGLDLGARDSCQIGGNIATNAGGMQTILFGNMREQVLGLEVITPDGARLNMMEGLRKNNTGYDLKQLFIGAEGTLGIITRAVLRLHPKPHNLQTAALACDSPEAAITVLRAAQQRWQGSLQRLEYLGSAAQEAARQISGCPRLPFDPPPQALLLLEVSNLPSAEPLYLWLEELCNLGVVRDSIPCPNATMAAELWGIRERCSYLNRVYGQQVKHDIAVPPERMPGFLVATAEALERRFPGALPLPFGHLGDGNLHYNVSPTLRLPAEKLAEQASAINRLIEDLAVAHGGTFSAEHGIGTTKKPALQRLKDPATLALMRTIKHTLDPHNIMNPEKVL